MEDGDPTCTWVGRGLAEVPVLPVPPSPPSSKAATVTTPSRTAAPIAKVTGRPPTPCAPVLTGWVLGPSWSTEASEGFESRSMNVTGSAHGTRKRANQSYNVFPVNPVHLHFHR